MPGGLFVFWEGRRVADWRDGVNVLISGTGRSNEYQTRNIRGEY